MDTYVSVLSLARIKKIIFMSLWGLGKVLAMKNIFKISTLIAVLI